MGHWLFSYGTLRQLEVQARLFGRTVSTVEDSLPGYRLEGLQVTDANEISMSGSDRHPILHRGAAGDAVRGARLELSDAELLRADEYEVDDYTRVLAVLGSGVEAWVYVAEDARAGRMVAEDSSWLRSSAAGFRKPRPRSSTASTP